MDIDSFWEYSDPALSEQRFRAALDTASPDERLELLTQIARTLGLRKQFEQAHALLDEIALQLANAGARPRLRHTLERGRVFNSSGDPDRARQLFLEVWGGAQAVREEGLAVDAAHMVAITYSGRAEAVEWNERGLSLARTSSHPKAHALIPAMLNNTAWDLHTLGRFAAALTFFEEAQAEWIARGQPEQIQIAKWSVARCLRSLGRYEVALSIQRALEAEHAAANTVDGYVFEEIAENLAALGQADEARPYFAKAAAELRSAR